MTSLAVIFILLLIAAVNNAYQDAKRTRQQLNEQQQQLEDLSRNAENRRHDLINALEGGLPKSLDLEISRDEKDPLAVIIIPVRRLRGFATDDDALPPGATEYLAEFAPALAKTVCATAVRKELNSVVVEGHADTRGSDDHNLELSTERSMRVVSKSLAVVNSDAQIISPTVACMLCSAAYRQRPWSQRTHNNQWYRESGKQS